MNVDQCPLVDRVSTLSTSVHFVHQCPPVSLCPAVSSAEIHLHFRSSVPLITFANIFANICLEGKPVDTGGQIDTGGQEWTVGSRQVDSGQEWTSGLTVDKSTVGQVDTGVGQIDTSRLQAAQMRQNT